MITPHRIDELLDHLSNASIVTMRTQTTTYTKDCYGDYVPLDIIYDDIGNIEVIELQELLCKYKEEL